MKTKWYNAFLEFSLLLIVFLIPLIFAPQLNVSFEFIKIATFRSLLLVSSLFFVVKVLYERRFALPNLGRFKFLWWLFGIYFLVILLAAIFSVAPRVAFFGEYFRLSGAYTFLHYGLFFFLLIATFRKKNQIRRIFYVIFFASLIVALFGLLQRVLPGFLDFWDVDKFMGRVFSTMGHPTYLSAYLVMLIPLGVSLFITEKSRWQYLFLISSALMVITLMLTLGRASMLGLFFAIMFFVIMYARFQKMQRLFWASLIVPLIGVLFLVSVNVFAGDNLIQSNFLLKRMVLGGDNVRSIETRLAMWPPVLKQIIKRPLLGYGPDTFLITFPKHTPRELLLLEDLDTRADRAHNEILDTLVSTGILGLLSYLAALFVLFWVGLRRKDIVSLGLLASILALFISNQFSFSLVTHYVYFWLFAALILLLSFSKNAVLKLRFLKSKILKVVIFVFALGLSGFLIFSHNVQFIRADYSFRSGLFHFFSDGPYKTLEDYKKAADIYPWQSYYSYAISNLAIGLSEFEDARKYLEKGGKFRAYDDQYFFNLGRLNAKMGNSFEEAFEKAIELAPYYQYNYLEYGIALFEIENYKKAVVMFEKYLSIVPRTWEWKSNLSQHPSKDHETYRIFYKLNPNFDEVFPYLVETYSKLGNGEKALYYEQFVHQA